MSTPYPAPTLAAMYSISRAKSNTTVICLNQRWGYFKSDDPWQELWVIRQWNAQTRTGMLLVSEQPSYGPAGRLRRVES